MRSAHTGRRSALLLVALACVLSAAPARGAVIPLHGYIAAAPVWDGSQALVATTSGHGYAARAIDPVTGASTTLARFPNRYDAVHLAASPSLIALQGAFVGCGEDLGCKYQDYEVEGEELSSAAPGAATTCVVGLAGSKGCGAAVPCPDLTDALVAADLLAYQSCKGKQEVTELIDRGSATATGPQLIGGMARPEALSGDWLVGLASGWQGLDANDMPTHVAPVLIERNLVTGAEPLHIPLPSENTPPSLGNDGEYPALAGVQEDGTVVYLLDSSGHDTLWTASPTDPTPRLIGASPAVTKGDPESFASATVTVGKNRVATLDEAADRLTIQSLAGEVLDSVQESSAKGFDFDGERIVTASQPCSESFLETWKVGEVAPTFPHGQCTAPLLSGARFSGRYILATLHCPSSSRLGCMNTNLFATGGHEPKGFNTGTSPDIELLPGQSHVLPIALGRGARRWLSHHRHGRVNVSTNNSSGGDNHEVHIRAL